MSLPKLSANAPAGLALIPETEWNEFDRKIWGGFDDYLNDWHNSFGGGPVASKFAIGRYNGVPAILSTSEDYKDWDSRFCRTISISTLVFCFENQEGQEFWVHTDIQDGDYFEGDATYDVFSDKLPERLMRYIPHMFADFDEEMAEYVMAEVGSCDEIKDKRVRDYIEKQLAELK